MSGNIQNSHSNSTNLQVDNIIDFPQQVDRTVAAHPTDSRDVQPALLRLWQRNEPANGQRGMTRVIQEHMQRFEVAGRPGAFCILRINEYRLLEETFGEKVAHRLQGLIGERLRTNLRGDDLLVPIAEDEFVLILDVQDDEEMLINIAQRLLRDCGGIYSVEGLRIHLDVSMGIARFPMDARDASMLMRFAHIALHETRATSPAPYHFFSHHLLNQLQNRVWMAAELEDALANERFELHYQPLFDIQSQRVLGAEALLRLRTEEGELIAPDRFIPLAEETGQIAPIGRWVVQQACQQLKQWHEQGHTHLHMAVNVSPAQLTDGDFVTDVCAAVERAGINYGDLELEITEGQVVDYLPLIESAFNKLKDKGVRIAIDDFGTGYSALSYLTRLHWSTVKIDRTFLEEIPQGCNAGRVVSAIIAMAGELGLQVTAEGIETEAQYRFLCQAGCHNGQGFGYARPQSAGDFQHLLQLPQDIGWSDQTELTS